MTAAPSAGEPRYRGRFAPSPTGPLHFGSLIAAVASCADARAAGGEWLLRIEDVDEPRTRAGADSVILAQLERYGFEWDGAVLRQRDRTGFYAEALSRLREGGQVYECACTRRELETAPLGAGGERVYPGTCRDGIPADRRDRPQRAWRVRVPAAAAVVVVDRLQGTVEQDLARDVGDFVLRRADGLHAYQLAVVVDDALSGVNAVVRGADLLVSTPRQILLQRLLGYATPSYLHTPVAIDPSGEKLSKQTRAAPLPDDPLPTLVEAWRFLDQPWPAGSAAPHSVEAFWAHARAAWTPARLPPVPVLPVPATLAARAGDRV